VGDEKNRVNTILPDVFFMGLGNFMKIFDKEMGRIGK